MYEIPPTLCQAFSSHMCSFCPAVSLLSILPAGELGESPSTFGEAAQPLLSSCNGKSAQAETDLN